MKLRLCELECGDSKHAGTSAAAAVAAAAATACTIHLHLFLQLSTLTIHSPLKSEIEASLSAHGRIQRSSPSASASTLNRAINKCCHCHVSFGWFYVGGAFRFFVAAVPPPSPASTCSPPSTTNKRLPNIFKPISRTKRCPFSKTQRLTRSSS